MANTKGLQNQFIDDDEEECRICRVPAEEGRPLVAPCKCSGSIGLVHQECLDEWLKITHTNKCDLCSVEFRFAPLYALYTPDKLPLHEVFRGIFHRSVAKWIPTALRMVIAILMWLFVLPASTGYLYHGWIHGLSSVWQRLDISLVLGDAVSGAVVAGAIVITFLSLMSFADFLRFHWAQRQEQLEIDHQRAIEADLADAAGDHEGNNDQLEGNGNQHENNRRILAGEDERLPPGDEGHRNRLNIDDAFANVRDEDDLIMVQQERRRQHQNIGEVMHNEEPVYPGRELGAPANFLDENGDAINQNVAVDLLPGNNHDHQMQDNQHRNEFAEAPRRRIIDGLQRRDLVGREIEIQDGFDDANLRLEDVRLEDAGPILPPRHEQQNNDANIDGARANVGAAHARVMDVNNNERFEPRFEPLQPILDNNQADDDGMDMEIHVALDELLGLRGPITDLLRNLLFVLAFNATFLGFFVFIPHTVGLSIIHHFGGIDFTSNSTSYNVTGAKLAFDRILNHTIFDEITNSISLLNAESQKHNKLLQLPDITTFVFGYLFLAAMVVMFRIVCLGVMIGLKKLKWGNFGTMVHVHTTATDNVDPGAADNYELPGLDEQELLVHADAIGNDDLGMIDHDDDFDMHLDAEDDSVPQTPLSQRLTLFLDCSAAIVKVCVLLFLKMLLLPLLLGLGLDLVTLDLLSSSMRERILFAGQDLFSALLLHWVLGITFMLLVTVSVLQLREVAHPDLLARVIRPQEPQPDLLGNLLQESGVTHTKRMILSLAIYVALLMLHVWLPSRLILFVVSKSSLLSCIRPKFYHILFSQVQVPVELIIVHLSMLAFLEKYKNRIGELQHNWLRFMCGKMGLTEYILPQTIDKFVFVGRHRISGNKCDEHEQKQKREKKVVEELSEGVSTVKSFWKELAAMSSPSQDFIVSRLDSVHEGQPIYEVGVTKGNGERDLCSSQPNIYLPITPPTSIPSSIGSFRLRRLVEPEKSDGSCIIEFWKEVRGMPIARPPEGWDDLGVGGAEVQGRWAWGTERLSDVEASVAERTHFRCASNRVVLLLKLIALLCLTWTSLLCLLCTAISSPLIVGRFIFFVLRLSDDRVHDPAAFAMGIGVLWLLFRFIINKIFVKTFSSFCISLKIWLNNFSTPPPIKVLILAKVAIIWGVVNPFALGLLYDLCIISSPKWWALNDPVYSVFDLLRVWLSGSFILCVWGGGCYNGVFSKDFWRNIGILGNGNRDNNGRMNINNDLNREVGLQDALHDSEDEPTLPIHFEDKSWNGEKGRVAQLINSLQYILLDLEWDKVDEFILLKESSYPLTKQLMQILVESFLLFLVITFSSSSLGLDYLIDSNKLGLFKITLFRLCAIVVICRQFMRVFGGSLQGWFEAAHNAARDDRYLIGRTLLQFSGK